MKGQPGRPLFGVGLAALGILDLVFRDTVMWKVLPKGAPAPAVWSVASGLLLIAVGVGILSGRLRNEAVRVLVAFLLVWDVVIGIPPVVESPRVEVTWLVLGMMTIVLVAAWLLTGTTRLRAARTIVGLSLIPVGLSHFFYLQTTLNLVPTWMPVRVVWVYLAGAGHIAAGVAVLFGVVPRLAALMEAGMLMAFAVLVWIPKVSTSPGMHFYWTELLGTWVIGAAMWAVADSYPLRVHDQSRERSP
ncbi:MAG TPA: DoxX family membrane protein [Gemmatimonadales bacterium]|nr:DoxX family membrane protein [Gemmatimonadales bacterium]